MTTRGIYVLRDAGIEYEVLRYRYERVGARVAADAIEVPHELVLKSLVFRDSDGAFLFALIGADANVSPRSLGRATERKHVEAAAPRDAERVTGYQVGGISPLGSRQALPVVLDEASANHPSLVLNAGARGTLVRLATTDLIRVTDAQIAAIRAA